MDKGKGKGKDSGSETDSSCSEPVNIDEKAIEVTVTSARQKTLTAKGREYTIENKEKAVHAAYRSVKSQSVKLKQCLAENSKELITKQYAQWQQSVELFYSLHDEIVNLYSPEQLDNYNLSYFDERSTYIENLKDTVQKWFSDNAKENSVKSHMYGSNYSNLNLEKAELEARAQTIKQKHAIEQEKLKLSQREEELELLTELSVKNAKVKALSNMGGAMSQSGITRADVNPSPFPVPNDSITVSNSFPQNQDPDFMSFAKHLRKPTTDISVFKGDVLDYQRFRRQFKGVVESNTNDYDERLTYLEQFTTGEAYKIVSGFSFLRPKEGYENAWKELQRRYGDPEVIAQTYIQKALNWREIRSDQPKGLDEFSIFLTECENAVKYLDSAKVLDFSVNLQEILKKLPNYIKDKWSSIVSLKEEIDERVGFTDLVKLVKKEAKKQNHPTYGKTVLYTNTGAKDKKKVTHPTKSSRSFATQVQNNESKIKKPAECLLCKNNHVLAECDVLSNKPYEERNEFVRKEKLCYGCLQPGHMKPACTRRANCKKCSGSHPTSLHLKEGETIPRKVKVVSAYAEESTGSSMEAGECAMAIIPVTVKFKDSARSIQTYAFIDPGSNVSFCTTNLMRKVCGDGKKMKITIHTMGEPHTMTTHEVKGLQISSIEGKQWIELPPLYTKETMPVSHHHIPTQKEIHQWSHLKDVEMPVIQAEIGLLIGNNVPGACSIIEFRSGPIGSKSPYAIRSILGWITWNLIRQDVVCMTTLMVNRAEVRAIGEEEQNRRLEILMQKSMNMDFPERIVDDKKENSQQDKAFLDKVGNSVKFDESVGHYVIGLPFKEKNYLPNNRIIAEKRLGYLQRKMRDETFASSYIEFMNKMLTADYAEVVPDDEIARDDGHVWYLPHHGVYHPQKKKLRVVFDCAALYHGLSLNQLLLQGPDLTNNLLETLLKFRQYLVGIIGDITAMFYQVRVPKEDKDYLRFLWWPNGNIKAEPVTYRMNVHIFGATSSPSCANYALRLAALENRHLYSEEAVQTVLKNFYVDDVLKSLDKEKEMVKLVEELKSICLKGGFELSKWISNNRKVLSSLPDNEKAANFKDLDFDDELPVERALGVCWAVELDALQFRIQLKKQPATRRGMLSTVCSVYDPLGLASPFILPAKLILQEMCRKQLSWDEEPEDAILQKWYNWLENLPKLEKMSIPRCYKPTDFKEVSSTEIHVFADASNVGYGIIAYLRMVDSSGKVHCSPLIGKSRVAPIKKITIPRMELTAATIAVRISNILKRTLEYRIDDVVFWTDSMSVLRYIQNESSRFQTFVANRVEVIRDGSNPNQWRYCPTELNPADDVSRGLEITQQFDRWVKGPSYLYGPESSWPKATVARELTLGDPEVKKLVTATVKEESPTDRLINYYSNWFKLKKAVASLLLFFDFLKSRVRKKDKVKEKDTKDTKKFNGELNVEDLKRAELAIVGYTQRTYFKEELSELHTNKSVKKSNRLYKLDPVLVDGYLRVGGRLSLSSLPFDSKHPLILPKDSHIAKLILSDIHVKVGHLGKNTILSNLRQQFWIINASSRISEIVSKCVTCRKYRARVCEQKMADLPADRVALNDPPFTSVGMDFFGPFEVKRGRSYVKRYGVIFTCLVTRAVHLEIAHSMDTDSCINAIRRFTARRGSVKLIRSDNGTNIVGAQRELKEAIDDWNQSRINNSLLVQNVKWEFNPPAGSHFGGVWERLIRSVRKILYSVVKEKLVPFDDESLLTFFCEVESILNNRPISAVSNDKSDPEPLTPNHLILMRSGNNLPCGIFDKADNYSNKRWKQIQYISNIFWKRFAKEYLPLLQMRQKWGSDKKNVAVNDIVLIIDSAIRSSYTLGRVVSVITDRKGLVRIANVKTKTGLLKRPVDKIAVVLESDM